MTITMNKYRKSQQMLDDAERRADSVDRSIAVVRAGGAGPGAAARHAGRSMSVTREVTRVVRV